jgi:transposase InsO family protein
MFCALFGLSKQAYSKQIKQKQQKVTLRSQAHASVLRLRRSMPRLGTRKLHYLLKQNNISVGRDYLFQLLREEGLLVLKRKKYTITTNSKHWLRKYPNLIKEISLVRPEQLWVADITYMDTKNGNLYLHLITDAYSKQIMGYELCNNMEAASTLKALQMAIENRQYKNSSLIHHSDRGLQYCSKLYTSCLIQNGITISMTENGDPYENAIAERVNGILKDEFGLSDRMKDIFDAELQTDQSIITYNNHRPHLSCSMLTPAQMHNQQAIKLKTYNKKAQTSLVDV